MASTSPPRVSTTHSFVRSTGDSVIVVNGNNTLSVGTTFRDGLGKVAAVNVAQDGLVIANGDVQAFTVRKNTTSWALKVGNSYLAISRDGLTTVVLIWLSTMARLLSASPPTMPTIS